VLVILILEWHLGVSTYWTIHSTNSAIATCGTAFLATCESALVHSMAWSLKLPLLMLSLGISVPIIPLLQFAFHTSEPVWPSIPLLSEKWVKICWLFDNKWIHMNFHHLQNNLNRQERRKPSSPCLVLAAIPKDFPRIWGMEAKFYQLFGARPLFFKFYKPFVKRGFMPWCDVKTSAWSWGGDEKRIHFFFTKPPRSRARGLSAWNKKNVKYFCRSHNQQKYFNLAIFDNLKLI